MSVMDIDALDRQVLRDQSKDVIEAERQCRITLAADALHPVDLEWNPGGRNGKLTRITLEPGKSVVQPLSKAQVWFGPFAVPLEYAQTDDERRKEGLRNFWATEKARYLNRYDYPRKSAKEMAPTGPHRSPDVSVTIIEADGSEHEPIRLHQLYKIGEWDPNKDSFAPQETADEIEARYKAELDERDGEVAALRRQVAELAGMVKGVVAAGGGK